MQANCIFSPSECRYDNEQQYKHTINDNGYNGYEKGNDDSHDQYQKVDIPHSFTGF